jgi:hypothetical protein
MRRAVALFAGQQITAELVKIDLAAGSVVCHCTITPPIGVGSDAVYTVLAHSVGSLSEAIVMQVSTLDSMAELATFPLHVGDMSMPIAAGSTELSSAEEDVGTVHAGSTANFASTLATPGKVVLCYENPKTLRTLCNVVLGSTSQLRRGPVYVVAEERVGGLVIASVTDDSENATTLPSAILCYTSREFPSGFCTLLQMSSMTLFRNGTSWSGGHGIVARHLALTSLSDPGFALLCYQRGSAAIGCRVLQALDGSVIADQELQARAGVSMYLALAVLPTPQSFGAGRMARWQEVEVPEGATRPAGSLHHAAVCLSDTASGRRGVCLTRMV